MISPILSHPNNLVYFDSLRRNQQSYFRSMREDTNAIRPLNPCNNNTSYEPPFSGKDENGEWKTYLVEYEFNGETWSILLPAYSWQEAQFRLQAIAQGKILGEIHGAIKA